MLHFAPSGRTRVDLPVRVRLHAIALITLVGAVALAACFRVNLVRSLAPAVDDSVALEVPGFAGSWTTPDANRWEIRRDSGPVPAYVVAVGPGMHGLAADGAARDDRTYFEARVGRAGSVLLLEMRPDLQRDTLLARISESYSYQLQRVYLVQRFDLHGDRFVVSWFVQDSVEAAVRDGRCATPFFPDSTRGMILSGTPAQLRAAWGCIAAQPGFAGDSTLFRRETIPRALAGGAQH